MLENSPSRTTDLHDPRVEKVQELLDNLPPDLWHDDGGLAGVAGLHIKNMAEERRHGSQDYLVSQELPVVTENGDIGKQPILLAQLGYADNVAVVALEGDNTVPRGHY